MPTTDMTNTAIKIENLSKRYRIGSSEARSETLGGEILSYLRAPLEKFRDLRKLTHFNQNENGEDIIWALKDVSFEVKRGEVVGVIGRNGAGKSTLLKILSRITEPTEGTITLSGRISSLLEVGTGFHPELTGRENIYLNGTILGMSKSEVDAKFDQIVEFSEISKFLDTPVKRYSSGMRLRLAFSVAAHLEPEILLIDEVLAVGDAAFQKKCLNKIGEVSKGGRTILFVSHNLAAISSLCNKAVLLESGRLKSHGSVQQTVNRYINSIKRDQSIPLRFRNDRRGTQQIRFTEVFCLDDDGKRIGSLQTGRNANIELRYECTSADSDLDEITFSISFLSKNNQPLILCRNDYSGDLFGRIPGKGSVVCKITKFPLMPGSYDINLYAERKGKILDWIQAAATLDVAEGDYFGTGRLPPKTLGNSVLVNQKWALLEDKGPSAAQI